MDPMSQGLPVEKCQMVQKEAASYDKRTRRIHLSEWGVGLYAISLVLLSIFLFMMNKAADQLGKFITEQNTAAIKLWTNLDHYSRHGAKEADAEASLPPGLFESLVEFSRCNASILKTVHRLRIDAVLVSSSSKLDDILPHLKSKAEEKEAAKKEERADAEKARKVVKTIQSKVEKTTLGDLGSLAEIKEKLKQEEKESGENPQ